MKKNNAIMKKEVLVAACIALVVGFLGYKGYQARRAYQVQQESLASFNNLLKGYELFRHKYALGDQSIMYDLSYGQAPRAIVVACSDSRVDPALLLQCEPGDLFVIRNVANIVPPYRKDNTPHSVGAALEFGISVLNIKHLILLGHSECAGVKAAMNCGESHENDFISNWVSLIKPHKTTGCSTHEVDDYIKAALHKSYENCFTFPWIKERVAKKHLTIHVWFFDIKSGQIFTYSQADKAFKPLDVMNL